MDRATDTSYANGYIAGLKKASQIINRESSESDKWVAEHGGIEELKHLYDRYYNLINDVASIYEKVFGECPTLFDNEKLLNELDKRLMPEGMGWPKFDDGKPVSVGDKIFDENIEEITVSFIEYGKDGCWRINKGYRDCVLIKNGECFKRPVNDSWEKYEEKLAYLLDDGDLAHTMTRRAKELAERNKDVG